MIIFDVKWLIKRLFFFKFHNDTYLIKSKSPGKNKILVRVSLFKKALLPRAPFSPLKLLRGFYMEGAYPVFGLLFKCVSNATWRKVIRILAFNM